MQILLHFRGHSQHDANSELISVIEKYSGLLIRVNSNPLLQLLLWHLGYGIYSRRKIGYTFYGSRMACNDDAEGEMKRARNELLQFLAGLAMLIAGLFIFSQKVMVYSMFLGGGLGFSIGGMNMNINNGLIIIPFIIGVVWMFASEGSFASKAFTAAGVLIIILAVIMTTNISLVRITLYEWVLILVLIFGGAGLLIRILFAGKKTLPTQEQEKSDPRIGQTSARIDAIEAELERMKKDK